jgi:DNA-binding NarL/FixJ family response regulator
MNRNQFTPTERNVLRLVGTGLPDKRIAKELNLGYRTVRATVSQLLKKTERENRTQLALYAIERHFIPPPDSSKKTSA